MTSGFLRTCCSFPGWIWTRFGHLFSDIAHRVFLYSKSIFLRSSRSLAACWELRLLFVYRPWPLVPSASIHFTLETNLWLLSWCFMISRTHLVEAISVKSRKTLLFGHYELRCLPKVLNGLRLPTLECLVSFYFCTFGQSSPWMAWCAWCSCHKQHLGDAVPVSSLATLLSNIAQGEGARVERQHAT
jgi:hypothetical protein